MLLLAFLVRGTGIYCVSVDLEAGEITRSWSRWAAGGGDEGRTFAEKKTEPPVNRPRSEGVATPSDS